MRGGEDAILASGGVTTRLSGRNKSRELEFTPAGGLLRDVSADAFLDEGECVSAIL